MSVVAAVLYDEVMGTIWDGRRGEQDDVKLGGSRGAGEALQREIHGWAVVESISGPGGVVGKFGRYEAVKTDGYPFLWIQSRNS